MRQNREQPALFFACGFFGCLLGHFAHLFAVILAEQKLLVFIQLLFASAQIEERSAQRAGNGSQQGDDGGKGGFFMVTTSFLSLG